MPETILRIVDWDELFENNRTRTMKIMQWIPIPNKHDGDGYTELIEHPDGPLHYACWVTITQVASRCHPRGTLLRSTKRAHDSASLSRITRIPAKCFEAAIPRLIAIGWLERISSDGNTLDAACQEGVRKVSGACQEGALEGKGRERKGTEGNGTEGKTKPCPAGSQRNRSERTAAVELVLNHYREHHTRANPGEPDRKRILARLAEGFSADDLIEAIDGNHRDPYCCGENPGGKKYHTLELIFRDSAHTQKYIEVPAAGAARFNEKERRGIEAGQRFIEKGMK